MSDNDTSDNGQADSYQTYHRQLIFALADKIKQTPPFNGEELGELEESILSQLERLCDANQTHEELCETGQWLINTIVSHYPHVTPAVARDLFWYFGGDCLHFLGDEEITRFQEIDEAYHLACGAEDDVDYEALVNKISQGSQQFH